MCPNYISKTLPDQRKWMVSLPSVHQEMQKSVEKLQTFKKEFFFVGQCYFFVLAIRMLCVTLMICACYIYSHIYITFG